MNRVEKDVKKVPSILAMSFLLLAACGSDEDRTAIGAEGHAGIEEIDYGAQLCAFTGDEIETVRYGGRLETATGNVYDFMSVECLAGFYLELEGQQDVVSLKVVDFTHGKRLLGVEEMVFLHSKLRPSPNGLYLTAIEKADQKMVTNIYEAYPGPLLNWDDVLNLVREEWDLSDQSAINLNR